MIKMREIINKTKKPLACALVLVMTITLVLTYSFAEDSSSGRSLTAHETEVLNSIQTTVDAINGSNTEMKSQFYKITKADTTLNWNVNGLEKWDGSQTAAASLRKDADGHYLVANGAELAGALIAMSNSKTNQQCEIEADMDLNGMEQDWISVALNQGQRVNGNNHTIYNMCVRSEISGYSSRTGFITSADSGTTIRDLTFSNAYIIGTASDSGSKGGTGIIGFNPNGNIEDVHITDSVIVAGSNGGTVIGRSAPGTNDVVTINNATAENCTVFGGSHIGSLTGPMIRFKSITNCYSTECTVFSVGVHSGGLISCVGGGVVENCFTDISVYGSNSTGVFTGASNGVTVFKNCYASGFIEGSDKVGGFIGSCESARLTNTTFENCYTTALVGLSKGSNLLGGFVGDVAVGNPTTFTNCYAAGEVGAIDTIVDRPSDSDTTLNNGGFAGTIATATTTFNNCYYDKQNTAMKEIGVGNVVSPSGLYGLLTTDSWKNASANTQAGNGQGEKGLFSMVCTGYDCSLLNHYPELDVFKNAGADFYKPDLVKANSLSSTSGLILDTWDEGLNLATGLRDTANTLGEDVYCTVRDVASGFGLTSVEVNNWYQIGTKECDEETGEPGKVTIGDKEYNVLSLKYQNDKYFADELVPGKEWLMVKTQVGDEVGYRKVRVIPTASVEAGADSVITSTYDHADDVKLFYSTAHRMSIDSNDITTGMFPDLVRDSSDAISDIQTSMMKNRLGEINTLFATSNDKFTDIDAKYMSESSDAIGNNATNAKLYTYAYEVNGFDSDNSVKLGKQIDLSDSKNAAQFNGYTDFANYDKRYIIAYAFVLDDGRVMQDAKLVRRAAVPFSVGIDLYKNEISNDTLYDNGGYLYAESFTDESGLAANFDNKASETGSKLLAGGAKFKQHSATAWKLKNSEDTLKSISLTLSTMENENFTVTVDNPTAGQTITVPMTVYRTIYRDGKYYTIPEEVNRSYTLMKTGEIWYLAFDKENEESGILDLYFNDVENDIKVDVVVNHDSSMDPVEPPKDPEEPSKTEAYKITKSSDVNSVIGGDIVKFHLKVENTGTAALHGIRVRDYVPEGTTFRTVDDEIGEYGVINGKEQVTWFIETLEPGKSLDLTFSVKVDECILNNYILYNTATYEYMNTTENPGANYGRDPENKTNTCEIKSDSIPYTGDNSKLSIYIILEITAVACLVIMMVLKSRTEKSS